MSAVPAPGISVFDGLLEGPTSAWDPDPAALADALAARGLPPDLLEVIVEGGRASLQPRDLGYPTAQFAGDPAEALALALQDLLGGNEPAARGWYSSLRVTSYEEASRADTLLQVGADGVHLLRRTQPWSPPPRPPAWRRLLRNWPVMLAALTALLAIGWLKREELREGFDKYYNALFGG